MTLCVTARNVASPGPFSDQGTKPAPSFVLLPRMPGYGSQHKRSRVVDKGSRLTILATRPRRALSVVFEKAVLLSHRGVKVSAGVALYVERTFSRVEAGTERMHASSAAASALVQLTRPARAVKLVCE